MKKTIDNSKLPQTLDGCWALIRKLTLENLELNMRWKNKGVASSILREKENFRLIDDVIESVIGIPFLLNDFFNKWYGRLTIPDEHNTTKTKTDLREHLKNMLIKNGYIRKVGMQKNCPLYRIVPNYGFVFRSSNELNWRGKGQDEGTFLIPSK